MASTIRRIPRAKPSTSFAAPTSPCSSRKTATPSCVSSLRKCRARPALQTRCTRSSANRRNASLRAQIDTLIEQGKLRPHDSAFSVRICAGMLKEVFVWSALFDASVTLPPIRTRRSTPSSRLAKALRRRNRRLTNAQKRIAVDAEKEFAALGEPQLVVITRPALPRPKARAARRLPSHIREYSS
ncbi:TetR/AcrR family transcriptional regulator C-terminal domain-containing protein [Parvibaculum sp.]|uniref:TetR/AcrR family transcriptional regulator C-terminal domain-containing protein n=1 Tax=Parvibaculum sp. TaxID=2024848 RepID=UPI003BABF40D